MSVTFSSAFVIGEGALDVNVSSANAAVLLELLGYQPDREDLWGEAEPADFLGRVVVARGLLDVATDDARSTPTVTEGGPGTGRALFIDCGRRPGYLAERLGQLEDLARYAMRGCGQVAWA